METRALTVRDVAEIANVSISTVSVALREGPRSKKVGKDTLKRISDIADHIGYRPRASARALATGKTCNIGFLLSSKVTLGFSNNYYATLMEGVYSCCADNNYHCVLGWSDMSSLDSFTMPAKVSTRAVDGLVVVGHIDDGIAQELLDSGVPFLILEGKNGSIPPSVLGVHRDYVQSFMMIFKYLYDLGHRRFGIGSYNAGTEKRWIEEIFNDFCVGRDTKQMSLDVYCCDEDEYDKFDFGEMMANQWSGSSNRPTAIIGHDQFVVGFLGGALNLGLRCPEDFSLFSTVDTILCKRVYPPITSVKEPVSQNAYESTCILLDYIQGKTTWVDTHRRCKGLWKTGDIVVRRTTGTVNVKN